MVRPRKEARAVRSRHAVRAAVVAIIAVGVLVVGAAPATAGGKHGKGKGDVLRLVGVEQDFEFIDVGPAGESLGDYFVFSEILYRRGEEVGTSGGQCVIVAGTPPYATFTAHCVATLDLERGQITLQGLVEFQGEDDMSPFTVAITGGTGKYRGAGGEARIRPRGENELVYKLKFDSKDKGKKKKRKKGRGRH
jgi:Allene oxide cyclase barrel like domain